MKLEYYVKIHMGNIKRMYVKDKVKRMWLMKLTKRSTIRSSDKQALEGLGIELVKVNKPKEL